MSSLKQLQTLFAAAMNEPTEDEGLLQQLAHYIDPAKLGIAEHLDIYRNAVSGSLAYALESIYPVCRQLVGDEFFFAMAHRYIKKHPSTSPDLNDYGQTLAEFIETSIPIDELPYLPDVARLEWRWHQTYHAGQSVTVHAEELSNTEANHATSIKLTTIDALHTLQSNYPVQRIWQINQDDYHGDETLTFDDAPIYLVIWRQHWDMRIDEVASDSFALLVALREAKTITEISEYFQYSNDWANALGYCLYKGWICSE